MIQSGRFGGMPLPNLPALTADERQPQRPVEIARNENPAALPTEAPPEASSATVAAAETELRKASERTGLTDVQLARIEESKGLIAAGNSTLALELSHQLNTELDAATTVYIVGSGDNLWRIARKSEVYGNADLWPLIWRANIEQMKEPSQLYKGMRLRVPSNPSVPDVTDALDYAHRNSGENMRSAMDLPTPSSTP